MGASVTDNVDNNLGIYTELDGVEVTEIVIDTSESGSYTITYFSVDQAGNRGEATRTVIVGTPVITEPEDTATTTPSVEEEPTIPEDTTDVDTTSPVISLIGDQTVELTVGDTYTNEGATAQDETDGDITANIIIDESTVDTTVAGSFIVTYNVADQAGNSAIEIVRTVNVVLILESIIQENATTTVTTTQDI